MALTDSKYKVDPMSFVMLVLPFCFMLTAPVLFLTSWLHPILVFRSVPLSIFVQNGHLIHRCRWCALAAATARNISCVPMLTRSTRTCTMLTRKR